MIFRLVLGYKSEKEKEFFLTHQCAGGGERELSEHEGEM
jgi:hypothetical protein